MPFPEPDSVDYNRWIVSKNVDCKLETIWNQGSPFNDLCPKVGWFKREKAPAGCVPIAVTDCGLSRIPKFDMQWS